MNDDAVANIRYLCSSDAEVMSDYHRINHLITNANALIVMLEQLRKEALSDIYEVGQIGEALQRATDEVERLRHFSELMTKQHYEDIRTIDSLKGKLAASKGGTSAQGVIE